MSAGAVREPARGAFAPRKGIAACALVAAFFACHATAQETPRGTTLQLERDCPTCRGEGWPAPASPVATPVPGASGLQLYENFQFPLRLERNCPQCARMPSGAMRPAAIEAIVSVRINLEPKGERDVLIAEDGDILLRESDIAGLAMGKYTAQARRISGIDYISLRSLDQVRFEFDEARLELNIRVDPLQLGRRQIIDLGPRRRAGMRKPEPGAGAFLNYNLATSGGGPTQSTSMSFEFGAPLGEGLFVTDAIYRDQIQAGPGASTVRLSSSLTRDDLNTLERVVIGDFVTLPSSLGSSLRLGGISWSKRHALDPYFIRFPGQIISATATLPSEVLVYVNGVLTSRQNVLPGAFQLQNLANAGGLQVTEVVIRDVLGNEQRIVNPFFVTDQVLRAGSDEYSLDSGFARRNFGVKSADYGRPGVAGFYRRGISDSMTLGFRGEALDGVYNAGPIGTFVLGRSGILSSALAYSQSGTQPGWAFTAGHAYTASSFATSIALRGESRDYALVGVLATRPVRSQQTGTLSWALGAGSQLRLTYTQAAFWQGETTRSQALSYFQRLGIGLSWGASLQHSAGPQASSQILLTLAYTLDRMPSRPTINLQASESDGRRSAITQIGGGGADAQYQYRVTQQRLSTDGAAPVETLNPFLQYNFSNVVARAELFQQSGNNPTVYNLSLQGAVVGIGGHWGLSRPIFDSFGFAQIGDVPGVRIYANNVEVGRTGADGGVFIPRLTSYFENSVSLEPKDLPIDYIVTDTRRLVVAPFRSGVVLDFGARRLRAVAGRIVMRDGQSVRAFGDAEGAVEFPDGKADVYTSRDGTFYLEDAKAGEFSGLIARSGQTCRFTLRLPALVEAVTDIGDIVCEAAP